MATANLKDKGSETEEEVQLIAQLQEVRAEKKKELTKREEDVKRLWELGKVEREKQDRLHEIKKERIESDQRERYGSFLEEKTTTNPAAERSDALKTELALQLRDNRRLEDQNLSAQRIAEETQLRQLDELPSTEEITELKWKQSLYMYHQRSQQQPPAQCYRHRSKYLLFLVSY